MSVCYLLIVCDLVSLLLGGIGSVIAIFPGHIHLPMFLFFSINIPCLKTS